MSRTTPWPICQRCKGIPPSFFFQPPDSDQSFQQRRQYNFHGSLSALRDSASRGCHACTLFYEAIREPYKSELHTAPVFLESLFVQGERMAKTTAVTADLNRIVRVEGGAEMNLKNPVYQCPYGRFEYAPIGEIKFATDKDEIPSSAKNYQDLISLYQDDEGAFKYVESLLNKCVTDHETTCNLVSWPLGAFHGSTSVDVVIGKRGLSTAPTRLVDIGSSDGTEPPRIVPGARCLRHEKPGYIALSYCNGLVPDNPPWQLTSQSKAAFEECLPLHLFPQTIRDAFEWTRRLGDRFIWIDNLCIMQDSEEDWNREALQMASIYGSATVTLVAAAGSIYGGMTDRRNPLRNCACHLSPKADVPNTNMDIYLLPSGQKSAPQKAIPTESRGWCYQEDVLSPRLVRFSLNGIQWQCMDSKDKGRARGLERLAQHNLHRWYLLWYVLIERYSSKQLSFSKDRLTAFSGIAAAKVSEDAAYTAGVCKKDVWAGLLWLRDVAIFLQNPGRRYDKFVAPSWSWASLDGPVLFREAQNRALKKLEYSATPWDPRLRNIAADNLTFTSTGPVSHGEVVLSAYAVVATTSSDRPNLFSVDPEVGFPGTKRLRSFAGGPLLGEVTYDCASEAREHESLHCILLHVVDTDQWVERGVAGLGVALKASPEYSRKQEYHRVGYVEFTPSFAQLAEYRPFSIV